MCFLVIGYCMFHWSLEFGQLIIICFFGHYPFRQTTEGANLFFEQGF